MASEAQLSVLLPLLDTEGGSLTIANFRAYYATYIKEQSGNTPVSFADYVCVLESFYRVSTIAGEA